jgi:hypothetical protein
LGSTLTTTWPDLTSIACSSTPSPDHLYNRSESSPGKEKDVLKLDAEV